VGLGEHADPLVSRFLAESNAFTVVCHLLQGLREHLARQSQWAKERLQAAQAIVIEMK
jgi:hypothetical protein